jgi:hypothetical protein
MKEYQAILNKCDNKKELQETKIYLDKYWLSKDEYLNKEVVAEIRTIA